MKRQVLFASLVLGLMPLAGCNHVYRSGVTVSWSNYPYFGWYDGYYGSIYDGYWGLDNFFYYRLNPSETTFRRGLPQHFKHGDAPKPGPHFHRFEGTLNPPPQGTRMPSFRPPKDRSRRN